MNCQEMLHCVSVTLGWFTIGLDLFSLTLCLGCIGQTHQGFLHFLNVLNWPLGCGGILELILCDDLDSRTWNSHRVVVNGRWWLLSGKLLGHWTSSHRTAWVSFTVWKDTSTAPNTNKQGLSCTETGISNGGLPRPSSMHVGAFSWAYYCGNWRFASRNREHVVVSEGADGKTLQEEEGVILRVIMQWACQMSSLVCRFASNMLQPSSTHLFGLLTPCWSL